MPRRIENLERMVSSLQKFEAEAKRPAVDLVVLTDGAPVPQPNGALFRMVIDLRDGGPRKVAPPAAPPPQTLAEALAPGAYEWSVPYDPFTRPVAESPSAKASAHSRSDRETEERPPSTPPESPHV